jgi:hypothetical protein
VTAITEWPPDLLISCSLLVSEAQRDSNKRVPLDLLISCSLLAREAQCDRKKRMALLSS